MAADLQIVSFSPTGRLRAVSWPDPAFVDGDYSLVQRLFKCLMTDPGDDEADPDWGAGLMTRLLGIPGNDLSAASEAVGSALRKAEDDLRGSFPVLLSLTARSISFDVGATEWLVDVLLTTTTGSFAVSLASR
jgi:hypothetical protein